MVFGALPNMDQSQVLSKSWQLLMDVITARLGHQRSGIAFY